MTRFVALYRMPADVEGFDRDYRHTHLPLVAATPGLWRSCHSSASSLSAE